MGKKLLIAVSGLTGLTILGSQVVTGWGDEISEISKKAKEKLSFGGNVSVVYQIMDRSKGKVPSKSRGSGTVDLGLSYKITENDEIYILGSFASGNGLSKISPFILDPNADDLEDDVKNINGHDTQDNILEAWYAHTFNFKNDWSLKVSAGIIDATVYIDDNRFANNEITQFMNDVFVNTPLTTPPSYDLGLVLELSKGPFSAKLLGMTTKGEIGTEEGEEEAREDFYQYYALQLGYTLKSKWGEGNYRIYGFYTSDDFYDWKGKDKENRYGIGVSIDQDLGFIKNPLSEDPIGFFLRAGWQNDDAQVDYKNLISFGFNIPFYFFGKKGNELGIGYAYLDSPDKAEISNTHAVEAYAKFLLYSSEKLNSDLTLDFQYMNDNYKHKEDDKEGYIWGIRWTLSF